MERMTQRTNGVVVYVGVHNKEVGGQTSFEVSSRGVREILTRLAEYEDTGLTPELVQETAELAMWVHENGLDKIKEWIKADKEGRLVVLPCKDWLDIVFGEQILFWGIDAGCPENPILEISVDDADRISLYDGWETVFLKGTDNKGQAWEFSLDAIGKTVFLTREEAEEALRRTDNG